MTKDLRTDTNVVYAQTSVKEYLKLVGEDFDSFEIQRNRQKHKAYERMKKDIKVGAVLPSITLAVKSEFIKDIQPYLESKDWDQLALMLSKPERVNILDGLQRTFILKDMEKQGTEFLEKQNLLLEFWIEENLKHLIYRIIVLNAGQKPMSMRHQVELLFSTIKSRLEGEVEGLVIYTEKDSSRRNMPKKYPLERIVTAYTSFLTKNAELKKENIIAQQLIESDILDSDENILNDQFIKFQNYLTQYTLIDAEVFRIYSDRTGDKNWLATENVMNSFFAAVSDFSSSNNRIQRTDIALKLLLETLKQEKVGNDPLGLQTLKNIIDGFNPRKLSIGYSTRKLIVNGFKEFFREEGETSLERCWLMEAE